MDTLVRTAGTRIIYGVGPRNAEIAIVGEAPGAQEDQQGKPFVGASGMLLSELLSNVGIVKSQCYITNTVKERPSGNNIKPYIDLSKKIPVTSPIFDTYVDYLKTELTNTECNIIIALGGVAFYALTGMKGITKYRGSVVPSTLIPDKKVIPIIHPSAALKQYIYRYFIMFDLKRALVESQYSDIIQTPRKYHIKPTFVEIMTYLHRAEKSPIIGFDLEVLNQEVSCISIAISKEEVMSIPFICGGAEYMVIPQEMEVWRLIAKILEDKKIAKIAQNASFDNTFLFKKYGIRVSNIHDTMVAMAILFPEFPKDLGFITSVYTDMVYYKDEGKSIFNKATYGVYNDNSFWMYNAKDSIVLMEAMPQMLEELKRQDNMETYNLHTAIIEPLTYMSERGILIDINALKEHSDTIGKEIELLDSEFSAMTNGKVNPASSKQVANYFYVVRGIKPYLDRKTHRPTTNAEALKRLKRKGIKEAEILLKIRELSKMKSTYLDMTIDSDNRLRSAYNPVGAKGGRLSSSKTIFGTGMNGQNIPKSFRKYMIADPETVIYNIDLSQAENRIVAYVGPDMYMIECFETGKDVHSITASAIFNIPADEIKQMDNDGVKSDVGDGSKSHRFWGKKANHGLNYGQGYKAFSLQNEIAEADGLKIVSTYFTLYPGVKKYQALIEDMLRQNRVVTGIFGRKMPFRDRWGYDLFKQAYSFIPQNAVGFIINKWGILYIYHDRHFKDVHLLNQVHDSIGIEIAVSKGFDYHADVLQKIKASLEQTITWRSRDFIIPADIKMGINFKDMEDVHDITTIELEEIYNKITEEKVS